MALITLVLLGVGALAAWAATRDPLHPLVVVLPQAAALYGAMPLSLQLTDAARFAAHLGDAATIYPLAALMVVGGFAAGVVAAGGLRRRPWRRLDPAAPGRARLIALAFGLAGLAAWAAMTARVGGFAAAYSTAYGGGWSGSGYVRELRFAGLIGALIVHASRAGRGLRPSDWALILLCVAPALGHGLLGARRGPAFLGLVVLLGGWAVFQRRRVPLPLLVAGGGAVGLLLLTLVANRGAIHLGASGGDWTDPLAFLDRWSSNEYLIGSAALRLAEHQGAFWGMREAAWLAARLVPAALWPGIWEDLPRMLGVTVDLTLNGGVDPAAMEALTGWRPSVGSAEGLVGSLWLEFGPAAPLAALAIGWAYGRAWALAATAVTARLLTVLLAALSVYLVMQGLDPWLYRLVLYGVPAWLAVRAQRWRPVWRPAPGVAA